MKTEMQPNPENYGKFHWQKNFFEFKFDQGALCLFAIAAGTLLSAVI